MVHVYHVSPGLCPGIGENVQKGETVNVSNMNKWSLNLMLPKRCREGEVWYTSISA